MICCQFTLGDSSRCNGGWKGLIRVGLLVDQIRLKKMNRVRKQSIHDRTSLDDRIEKQFSCELGTGGQMDKMCSLNRTEYRACHFKKGSKEPSTARHMVEHRQVDKVQGRGEGKMVEESKRSPNKNRHRKGKSVNFQTLGLPMFEIDELKGKCKGKEKSVKIGKTITEMMVRNTVSELKDYRERSPEKKDMRDTERNFQKIKKKVKTQEKVIKKGKKQKQIQRYATSYIQEPQKPKKQLNTTSLVSKPSKHLTSMASYALTKNDWKSTEMTARRCKSSLKDKINKSSTSKPKKFEASLPFPSKVNSLYSNTTSLFCSKAQLEPASSQMSYRIITEQSQETTEMREFESMALMRSKEMTSNSQIASASNISSEQSSDQTHRIIDRYLMYFGEEMEQMRNRTEQSSGMQIFDKNQDDALFQSQFQAKELKQGKEKTESENKMEEVIKLISDTEALGDKNRESILNRIREIIPIGQIGSKELKLLEQKEEGNKITSLGLNTILKQTEKEEQWQEEQEKQEQLQESRPRQPELYNIKVLDQILTGREKELTLRLEQELWKLENEYSDDDDQESKQQEKERVTKWINLLIQETANTRAELWKGFNFARQLLGGDYQPDQNSYKLNQGEAQADDKSQKQNAIGTDDTLELIRIEQANPDANALIKANCQFLVPSKSLQEDPQLNSTPPPSSKVEQLNDSSDSNNLRNFIMFESAQRLEYDFSDDSPLSKQESQKNLKKILGLMSDQKEQSCTSYDELEDQFSLLSIDKNQLSKLNIFNNLKDEQQEEICEYVLIDLCIDMADEYSRQSKVMQSVQSYVEREKMEVRRKRGFRTGQDVIRGYLNGLITFAKSKEQLYEQALVEIQKPMGPTALELLSYIRPREVIAEGEIEIPNIFEVDVFQKYDLLYLSQMEQENEWTQVANHQNSAQERKQRTFLRNAMHIHNKAIFDAFNQCLDQRRPFGQWGEPFTWQTVSRFPRELSTPAKETMIVSCIETTTSFGQYLCGVMPDKEYTLLSAGISVDQLHRLRGERLFKMLTDYLEEFQEKLRLTDDDRTEILVMISDTIFEGLVQEMVGEMEA